MFKTYSNRHGREFQAEQHEVFDRCNTGIYQVSNLRKLRDLRPQARRIIDVGGHVGTSCMEYATWAKRVDSFEAHPATFALLEQNIKHNVALSASQPWGSVQPWYNAASTCITADIKLHNVALMDKSGTAYATFKEHGLASYVRHEGGEVQIPARTIDSYNFTDVDVMKLDTEGTEWLIVQGAKATIELCRPVMQIEMWGWERRFGLNNLAMLDYFKSLDYVQVDVHGRPMPWDFAGRYNKAMGNGKSAMDRFFVPR